LIHIFGDISSPILLGAISNLFGRPGVVESPVGRLFASIGAHPVGKTNLTVAMLSVVPILALGCLFFLLGSRHLAEDMERVEPSGDQETGASALVH
jgi:hypothetical protein